MSIIDEEDILERKKDNILEEKLINLILEGVDIETITKIMTEESKRLDIEFEKDKKLNTTPIYKEIDRQNNLIKQKNFLSQINCNPKKKNKKKRK